MPRFVDISGTRFARLVVLGRSPTNDRFNHVQWSCQCDCGRIILANGSDLKQGKQKSCGCLRNEQSRINGIATTTHGHMSRLNHGNGSPEYMSWKGMMQRCENPSATGYDRYGGRGITVCERWHSFENFLADMGSRPGGKREYSIDRVDNEKGYELANCRWATRIEQNQNRKKHYTKRKDRNAGA